MKPDVGAFLAFLTLMADGAVDGTNHHFAVHHIPEKRPTPPPRLIRI